MGAEAFMVDAGWYGAKFGDWPALRGDWNEGDWLPGGSAGIRNRCHKKGLLFGLWHEAESISKKSEPVFQCYPCATSRARINVTGPETKPDGSIWNIPFAVARLASRSYALHNA